MVIFGDLVEKMPGADGQLHSIHAENKYDKVRTENAKKKTLKYGDMLKLLGMNCASFEIFISSICFVSKFCIIIQ